MWPEETEGHWSRQWAVLLLAQGCRVSSDSRVLGADTVTSIFLVPLQAPAA